MIKFYWVYVLIILFRDYKSWRVGQMASGLPDPLLAQCGGDGSSGEGSGAGASSTGNSSDHIAQVSGSQEVPGK